MAAAHVLALWAPNESKLSEIAYASEVSRNSLN